MKLHNKQNFLINKKKKAETTDSNSSQPEQDERKFLFGQKIFVLVTNFCLRSMILIALFLEWICFFLFSYFYFPK